MDFIMLTTAFGGGILGALIGGVPAFVFTGLTALIAIFAGDSGMPMVEFLSFGSVFGPHVVFGGAVAAAAYAKKKGIAQNGQDIITSLFGSCDASVLLVGGIFGVIGYLINFIYSQILGNVVFGSIAWTDTVALTVFTSDVIARFIFTKSGFLGRYTEAGQRQFFPKGKRLSFLVIVGLGVGVVISGLASSLGSMALEGSTEAFYLFSNTGNIGFAIAAISLAFMCMGLPIEGYHHTAVTAGTTAMIVFAGTLSVPLTMISGIIVGVVVSVACECAALTVNSYADSHIDPPATIIMIVQFINLTILQTAFPSIM